MSADSPASGPIATPAPSKFAKVWADVAQQVAILESRGLIISDKKSAEHFLAHINYYRFSGYCLAFESARHVFVANTTFEAVVAAYEFDMALRDLITEALEVVEVDFRTAIAYAFGKKHGPFGHVDKANFYNPKDHGDCVARLRHEAERSSELFVVHFRKKYLEFPDLPVWIVTEVMSFGSLSKMVHCMHRAEQAPIAYRYRIQPRVVESWMHHLVYVRNLCAHHSRLWDRIWTIKPELPAGKAWNSSPTSANTRLSATLLILSYLMKHIASAQVFAASWRQRVESHVAGVPKATDALGRMGLWANWNEHPAWL